MKAIRWGGGLTAVGVAGCIACCAVPLLITAGVLGGAAAAALAWLPWASAALVALGLAVVWVARSRSARSACAGDQGCSCGSTHVVAISATPPARD